MNERRETARRWVIDDHKTDQEIVQLIVTGYDEGGPRFEMEGHVNDAHAELKWWTSLEKAYRSCGYLPDIDKVADRLEIAPKTPAELAFLGLGPVAEAFLRAAAASGATRLHLELAEIVPLAASHGRDALVAALERALAFRRFGATDVRAILAAGVNAPRPVQAGADLPIDLPAVPVRPLSAYALEPSR